MRARAIVDDLRRFLASTGRAVDGASGDDELWEARRREMGPDWVERGHTSARRLWRAAYALHVTGNVLAAGSLVLLVAGAVRAVMLLPFDLGDEPITTYSVGAGVITAAGALFGLGRGRVETPLLQAIAAGAIVYGLRSEPDFAVAVLQAALILVYWSIAGRSVTWQLTQTAAGGLPVSLGPPRPLDRLAYYRPERIFIVFAAAFVGSVGTSGIAVRHRPFWHVAGTVLLVVVLQLLLLVALLTKIVVGGPVMTRWANTHGRRLLDYLKPPVPAYNRPDGALAPLEPSVLDV